MSAWRALRGTALILCCVAGFACSTQAPNNTRSPDEAQARSIQDLDQLIAQHGDDGGELGRLRDQLRASSMERGKNAKPRQAGDIPTQLVLGRVPDDSALSEPTFIKPVPRRGHSPVPGLWDGQAITPSR